MPRKNMVNPRDRGPSGLFMAAMVLVVAITACTRAATPTSAPAPTPTRAPISQPTVIPQPTSTPTTVPLTPTPAPTPSPTAIRPENITSINLTKHTQLGPILTDQDGNTLYLFTRDQRNKSNCSGTCLNNWPVPIVKGTVAAGEGVAADRIGTISRDDGTVQPTYNGWPLYYHARDTKAGDVAGQNVAGVWFVVSSYGGANTAHRKSEH